MEQDKIKQRFNKLAKEIGDLERSLTRLEWHKTNSGRVPMSVGRMGYTQEFNINEFLTDDMQEVIYTIMKVKIINELNKKTEVMQKIGEVFE